MNWAIVIVFLAACSEPREEVTSYVFSTEAQCEQGIKDKQAQLQWRGGSYIVCKKPR